MSTQMLSKDNIRTIFLEELVAVAPDIDPATVQDNEHLQHDLALDSMDFLNLVIALHKKLGINIREADYPQLATISKAVAFLAGKCV